MRFIVRICLIFLSKKLIITNVGASQADMVVNISVIQIDYFTIAKV